MSLPVDGYQPNSARVLVEVYNAAEYSKVFRFDATVTVATDGMNQSADIVFGAVVETVIEQARNLLDPTIAYTTEASVQYTGTHLEDALPASGGV